MNEYTDQEKEIRAHNPDTIDDFQKLEQKSLPKNEEQALCQKPVDRSR